MNVLVIGGGAREHAICDAVTRSKDSKLYSVMRNLNPGIAHLSEDFLQQKETDVGSVVDYAGSQNIDMVLIGPEAPLLEGLTDALIKEGIRTSAPSKKAARIETDKEWMRHILQKYEIAGQIKHESFTAVEKALTFIEELDGEVALKPIGLTGGKGVWVAGDHFTDIKGAEEYIKTIFSKRIGGQAKVLIEEKQIGEEFTLQAFSDGTTILPLPAVKDHKRLHPDDKGPNTGGMGSYSIANGLLPFITKSDYEQAAAILQDIVESLALESCPYVGPIYGQFIVTSQGIKIIEINARFGDPEAMNVLPLLKTDFLILSQAMVDGLLHTKQVSVEGKATVCKYVVPEGYGIKSMENERIYVDEQKITKVGSQLFYASVNKSNDIIKTTSSRALAIVGFDRDISSAEEQCEKALQFITGDHIYIRHDVGTQSLIEKQVNTMKRLRGI